VHNKLKKIGITQRLDCIDKYVEVRSALDIRWSELLNSIDLVPIPLTINIDIASIADLKISGIILTGGNDLSSQSGDELSILRDKHEYQCLEYAIENSLPIFGVCRGMQIIAEYFGTTFKKVDNHVSIRHKIEIIGQSNFKSILNKIENVNSYHNFAIDKLGDDLQTVATCSNDNTIEAIQHNNHLIFGQMWHPERENPFNKYNSQLISEFFDG